MTEKRVKSLENAVADWLATSPGTFTSKDAVGGRGNLEMFRNALAMHGFKPEPLGNIFILRLPSQPTGGADWNRIARMNNIVGR